MVDHLEDILGQPLAVKQLKALQSSNRIPHALLFTGPDGVGKFYTALQFIKSLNKENHLKKVENLEEPFVKYITPLPRGKSEVSESSGTEKLSDKQLALLKDELSKKIGNPFYKLDIEGANNVKISSIREIRKFLSLEYHDINYRVVVIDEAHLMNAQAQNALLKSLEEPPEGVIFILLTPFDEKLLPTIRSRCWGIQFKNLKQSDVSTLLVKYFNFDKEEAEKVSLFCNGSVQSALELLESDISELLDSAVRVLRFAMAGWFNSAVIEMKNSTNEFELTKMKELITLILSWLNDVGKNRAEFDSYYFRDHLDTVQKFNSKFPDAEISEIYSNIEEIQQSMDKNILLNVIILNLILLIHSIVNRY